MNHASIRKQLTSGRRPLVCTASTNCWCFKITTQLPIESDNVCLTPEEILMKYGHILTEQDKAYLIQLRYRELV